MKTVQLTGLRQMRVVEVAAPRLERPHDVLLTDQRTEGLRPPLARKDLIAHGGRF